MSRQFILTVETPLDVNIGDMRNAGGGLYTALERAGFFLLKTEEVEVVHVTWCPKCRIEYSGVSAHKDGKTLCVSCMQPGVETRTKKKVKEEANV